MRIVIIAIAVFLSACTQIRTETSPPSPATVTELRQTQIERVKQATVSTIKVSNAKKLPKTLNESSGLVFSSTGIWSINDSGGKAVLYRLSPELEHLFDQIALPSLHNHDWEALTANDEYIYIADTGNNKGNRENLALYKVDMQALNAGHDAPPQRLAFSYLGYQAGSYKMHKHNFDCEAIAWVDDAVWLFSKNWQNLNSEVYQLNPTKNEQQLEAIQTLPVKGLITGASYNAQKKVMALLGYSKPSLFGHSFIWFAPVEDGKLNWQLASRHVLPRYAQWEAITWLDDDQLLISAEQSLLSAASTANVTLQWH
ncbi:MAG: hypothetical protein HRU20_27100 [Pseudomonadales bacterium]|nr:hypothetical protein [Pseudomonadales bacterium]